MKLSHHARSPHVLYELFDHNGIVKSMSFSTAFAQSRRFISETYRSKESYKYSILIMLELKNTKLLLILVLPTIH